MCSFRRFCLRNSFAIFKVPTLMSKRMAKRSHAWPRGKLIFAVPLFFQYICSLPQPTALDLFRVNCLRLYNKHTNKTFKGGRAGSASRFKPFRKGVRRESFKNSPEGTPLYKPYRYVPLQRVGVLHRFGLKTGLDFAQFGLESGVVLEETTGVYESIYCFNSKRIRKKKK